VSLMDVSGRVGHTDGMNPRDWGRLARYVRERREDLGFTQEDVATKGGPSTATLRLIENGTQETYRQKSLRQLEAALGWEPGSVRKILDGGEPVIAGRGPSRASDPAIQYLRETPGLSPEFREALVGLVLAMREDEANGTAHGR
jgi:transcriptional regulator with XRE-family HTH domain